MTKLADKIESLEFTLRSYQEQYEDEKTNFVKKVETNPAYAISWAGTMVEKQAQYEAVYDLIGEALSVEAVEDFVKSLERKIRYGHGTSTSKFSNAVEYAQWEAQVKVLERLESWLTYAKQEES